MAYWLAHILSMGGTRIEPTQCTFLIHISDLAICNFVNVKSADFFSIPMYYAHVQRI